MMAGPNPPKQPSSSSNNHRKSRWESSSSTANKNPSSTTADHKSSTKPSPSTRTGPPPSSAAQNKSQSDPNQAHPPFPFPDPAALGPAPPPAYGFHMLERRTIVLYDGSVRSYFALPPDYQDFPIRPILGPRDFGSPSMGFRDNRDYWNSPGDGPGPLKRKYGDEGKDLREEKKEKIYTLGPGGSDRLTGISSPLGNEETRAAKFMRVGGGFQNNNAGFNHKHLEVDQSALKKAFLHFVKAVFENTGQKKNYLEDGKQGRLQCLACGKSNAKFSTEIVFSAGKCNAEAVLSPFYKWFSGQIFNNLTFLGVFGKSSKDFSDMHGLIMHTYYSDNADLRVDHLGLHKALCVLMGWNYSKPPDNSKAYRFLPADEAVSNQEDLIMWPPVVIVHNTITGKGKDGRMEGLGNKAMDSKLRGIFDGKFVLWVKFPYPKLCLTHEYEDMTPIYVEKLIKLSDNTRVGSVYPVAGKILYFFLSVLLGVSVIYGYACDMVWIKKWIFPFSSEGDPFLAHRYLGFGSGKCKSMYGREGHLGITVVKFASDHSGLIDAVRLAEYFEKENRGRKAWSHLQPLTLGKDDDDKNPNLVKVDERNGEKKRIFYGYLGTVADLDKVDFDMRNKVVIESRREHKGPR
ncbi:suppressor of gene silencing 3 [Gossypium australe]|uniref:Suppressor of gene silencing 3 n=1 Tax=Gossypium australe TaxID=47621 RepID=A0A5B6UCX4_9ROSI|nr:suppressor of gene silencing 3 [Gossypium australe]